MNRYTGLARNLSYMVFGGVLAWLAATAPSLSAFAQDDKADTYHRLELPEMNFTSDPCAQELAAYYAALGVLQNAQQAADAAWEALQNCYANNPPPPPTAADLAGTVSILE